MERRRDQDALAGRYSTVERALQDAFGIQVVWEKEASHQRKVPHEAALLQKREDSAKHPVLTLEAALAKANLRKTVSKEELTALVGVPALLVGLSKTCHPSYEPQLVAEMARQFWKLEPYVNTSLVPFKKSREAVLLAWSSMTNHLPMIVGAWRIGPVYKARTWGRPLSDEGLARHRPSPSQETFGASFERYRKQLGGPPDLASGRRRLSACTKDLERA